MSDRGKAEFNTMDITIGDVENKNFEPSVLKGFEDLDESIVIKETSKEHYANRFMTAAPGKENINNLEKIKDTSMANDAFKKYNKFHASGPNIDDNIEFAKRKADKIADNEAAFYSKEARKRLQGNTSDLENHRANKFLKKNEENRARLKQGLVNPHKPNPVSLTDTQKYDRALHVQGREKILESAKKLALAKKKSLLKVIKEFNLYEE